MPRDLDLPRPVEDVLAQLRRAGHEAYVVGGCVRDAMLGREVRDYDVASSAIAPALLASFPRAVPIGGRHGTVMIPSAAGPIDVTPYRAGPDLLSDLALRDFTINAVAYDPAATGDRFIDPHGGLEDLARRVVRAVGSPTDRLDADPLRALRALRIAADLDAVLDSGLDAVLGRYAAQIAALPGERIRAELERLLLSEAVGPALARLRSSGLAAQLAPGTRSDAAEVVAQLPAELPVRLVGWLREADAGRILSRLRFPRRLVAEVQRLVRLHPLRGPAARDTAVWARRTLARVGSEGWRVLLAVAEAEAHTAEDKDAEAQLAEARLALLRAEAEGAVLGPDGLAISGREVMKLLGERPGPRIGKVLAYLTEAVLENPQRNTRAGLAALVEAWRQRDTGKIS